MLPIVNRDFQVYFIVANREQTFPSLFHCCQSWTDISKSISLLPIVNRHFQVYFIVVNREQTFPSLFHCCQSWTDISKSISLLSIVNRRPYVSVPITFATDCSFDADSPLHSRRRLATRSLNVGQDTCSQTVKNVTDLEQQFILESGNCWSFFVGCRVLIHTEVTSTLQVFPHSW